MGKPSRHGHASNPSKARRLGKELTRAGILIGLVVPVLAVGGGCEAYVSIGGDAGSGGSVDTRGGASTGGGNGGFAGEEEIAGETSGGAGTPSGGVGASSAQGGGGGASGGTGGGGCEGPYQVLKVLEGVFSNYWDHTSSRNLVGWPALHRVAVNTSEGVQVYAVEADGVTLLETITPADLGVSGEISEIVAYGEEFVALVREEDHDEIVSWHGEQGPERLPAFQVPEQSRASHLVADASSGTIALSLGAALIVASHSGDDDTWLWSDLIVDERPLTPLMVVDNMILVGVEEALSNGSGEKEWIPARVEWRSKNGAVLESFETQGNPSTALYVGEDVGGAFDEGLSFLIGETNSFWGSYQAALELYGEAGTLSSLAKVPVQSGGDGTDGAFDLAIVGDRLFVANCESGLLTGAWPDDPWAPSTPQIGLRPLLGPWQPDLILGVCSPTAIEAIDDVIVVGGENVVFARLCGSVPVCLAAPNEQVLERKVPISREECERLDALALDNVGADTGCPFRTSSLGMIEGTEGGECCRPIPEPTSAQCDSRNGEPINRGDDETCPDGRRFLGAIDDGEICCERMPELSADKCEELGGERVDYTLSSHNVHRDGCRGGRRALGFITPTTEPALCCEAPKSLSFEECHAQCGQVLWSAAPGNENVLSDGCPNRREWMGNIEIGNQQGICCATP